MMQNMLTKIVTKVVILVPHLFLDFVMYFLYYKPDKVNPLHPCKRSEPFTYHFFSLFNQSKVGFAGF
jgi:hypothetical protein